MGSKSCTAPFATCQSVHVCISATKPFLAEVMFIRNFEINPALLRNSLGYRLLIREQTSGEVLVLDLRQLIVSSSALLTDGA